MKRILFMLVVLLLLASVLSGCTQPREVSVGLDGIVTAKDADRKSPDPSLAPTAVPTPAQVPTPAPTEAPGWFYHYDKILIDGDNVQFTLRTMEYDYDAKSLTGIADYANTGEFDQIVVFIYVYINDVSYSLHADVSTENDKFVFLESGEKRTIPFFIEFTDEEVETLDLQNLQQVQLGIIRLEASDTSQPENYGILSFDPVDVELKPAA